MKMTIEIRDSIYRQVKALAALQGKTVRAVVFEAIREKLGDRRNTPSGGRTSSSGWRSVYGKGDTETLKKLDRFLNKEFSQADLASWE